MAFAIVRFKSGEVVALTAAQYCNLDFSQVAEVRIVGARAMGGGR